MKLKKSITRFILIVLAAGIILYSGAIFLIVHKNLNEGLVDYFKEELNVQSNVIVDEMQNALDNSKAVACWIQNAYEAIYPEYGFDRTIMTSFADGAQKYMGAKNIVFFNSFGMQVSSPKFGVVPKTDIIKKALTGVETVRFEKTDADVYATVILPLKSENRVFGAVEIRTPIATDELVNTVSNYTQCDVTIFNENERFVTSLSGMKGTEIDNTSVIDAAKEGNSTLVTSTLNGKNYLSFYFPFKDHDGNFITTLFAGKRLDIAKHLSDEIFKPLIFIIVIFTVALLVGFTLLVYMKMNKPLANVRKAVANLSSGDADLTVRLSTASKDEFAGLSDDVNKFIEMLQQIIKELNTSQGALDQASENLGDNAQSSASATAQILANIESVRKQSQNQSEAVQNTSNVLEMSSTSVDVLSRLIDDQTAGISESSAAIEEMLGNITAVTSSVRKMASSFSELDNTVTDGKTKLASVDQKVQQIAEQSKMLIQANTVISQIASETNLLAMNAAIEAAHAGEAGKGFSVVAEEIRKLAENSGVQSKNISSELKGISGSIQDVVSLSRDSQTAFGAIVNQLGSTDMIIREINNAMEEQQTASKQIFEALSNMKNQAGEVTSKARDMSEGITNVARDMNTVNQISTTILGSMDEMTVGMQQIGEATQNVSDLASLTKQNIGEMSSKLSQFKV